MKLPAAIVSERDARIFNMKQGGATYRQIGAALGISQTTAHAGYMRELKRKAKFGSDSAHDSVWAHLEQLDTLIQQLWPMTKPHEVEAVDSMGNTIKVKMPPSMDAIDRVGKLLQAKAKIMGYEKDVMILQNANASGGPEINAGGEMGELTPERAAKQFATELLKHGVFSGPVAETVEKMLAKGDKPDIVDAEIISDSFDTLELESGDERIPPPWQEDDEDEYIPGAWLPDDMPDGNDMHGGTDR